MTDPVDRSVVPSNPAPDSAEIFTGVLPYLKRSPRWRTLWGVLGVAFLLADAGAAYALWWFGIRNLVHWGFQPLTWNAIPATVAILALAVLPLVISVFGFSMVGQAMRTSLEAAETEVNQNLTDIRAQQRTVEQEVAELERDDPTGLMNLVRYSRLQLEAYYTASLRQTQESYRNSVVAMWLGFSIIILGVVRQIVPSLLPSSGAQPVGFDPLVLAAGIVVELISALFLWVYKSAIEQLTYYYDRQMHLHGVLLTTKITSGMKEPDETRKLIVSDILAKSWRVERSPLRDSAGLKALLSSDSKAPSP